MLLPAGASDHPRFHQVYRREPSSMKHTLIIAIFSAMLSALCSLADAQGPTKLYRVGYLGSAPRGPFTEAFEQGMRDSGYELGKTLVIEYRSAEGQFDRLPALAAELLKLNV